MLQGDWPNLRRPGRATSAPGHIIGDSYAEFGATVTDTAPDRREDTNLGYQTFLNGTLILNITIDTSQVATFTIDYVVADSEPPNAR